MILLNLIFVTHALFNPAHAAPEVPRGIDPQNYEPGCNVDNAPSYFMAEHGLGIIDGPGGYKPCDNSNMGYRIRKAMMNLGKMLGMDGRNRWNPSIIGYNPYKFILDRVDYLEFADKTDEVCDKATGGHFYVQQPIGSTKTNRIVALCAGAKDESDLGLMMLLLHEARHSDGKHHVPCETGPAAMLKSFYACDPSVEDQGAYAVGLEFLLAASHAPSISPANQESARAMAIDHILQHFNKLPADLSRVALEFPVAGGVYVFDGQRELKILSTWPAGSILSQNTRLTFMNSAKGKDLSYTYVREHLRESDDKSLASALPEWRNTFVDYAQIGDMWCWLYTHHLFCAAIDRSGAKHWKFDDRVAVRFKILDNSLVSDTLPKGSTAYFVEQNGKITPMRAKFADMVKDGPLDDHDRFIEDFVRNLVDAVTFPLDSNFPYRHLFLPKSGGGVAFTGKDGKSGTVPGLQHLPLKRLLGPTIWSDSLENL